MSLSERVQSTVAATLNLSVSDVTPATSAENCGAWDSLAQVNLMMALEQTFDIQLEIEDFERLSSVAAIVGYLESQGIQ